jgi:hypothetical protein
MGTQRAPSLSSSTTATAAGFCGLGDAARSNARRLASMAERVGITSALQ